MKILKQNANVFSDYIYNLPNFFVNKGKCPDILKQANIRPAFKKGYRGYRESYHLLPVIARIFEKLLGEQVTLFMDKFLSKCFILNKSAC